ncbi:hypothetical protein [Alteriqipengyuania lutimaris]|uniref:hypothetical protein n=1 Tax=Alteriqipengyuania lutimaris TaxID=1538146 RepID=UPI0017A424A7|nr:hypothetical protein [Alteriqipengyuania lutimaris]MBB3032743.1 hypothetical protein [Alteriqipengyuania lutimaris]
MWTKIAAAFVVAGLAALLVTCGGDAIALVAGTNSDRPDASASLADDPSGDAAGGDDRYSIACALNGAGSFADTCTVEPRTVDGEEWLAVFHPNGGFRLFAVLADGSGLAAVAGAEKVDQMLSGDTLEISIAGNRYRFPATAD